MQRSLRTALLALAMLGQILAPFAYSADPTTEEQYSKWRLSLNAQNPALGIGNDGAISGHSRSAYQRMPRVTSHRMIRISGGWGGFFDQSGDSRSDWYRAFESEVWKGVFLGREPAPQGGGQLEPLGVPSFDFERLPVVEGESQKVRLSFGLANGTSWSCDVAAAVVTPMTAAAMDGRIGLFTLTPSGQDGESLVDETGDIASAAIHPALQGHRLAYRPAILDLFAENIGSFERILLDAVLDDPTTTDEERREIRQLLNRKMRFSLQTANHLEEQREASIVLPPNAGLLDDPTSFPLSAVIESRWSLTPTDLTSHRIDKNGENASFKFVHRVVHSSGEGRYRELDISEQLNREIFGSLTEAERQLVQEYNDAVIVFRIIYAVRQGWIVNFDRQQNWSRMIDALADVYKANLDEEITAERLAEETAKWASGYNGKNTPLPTHLRLK